MSWKVERAPNSGRNCFGRTSREAGHSRVPAPPHMIRGIIRSVIALLRSCSARDTTPRNRECRLRSSVAGAKAGVAHQIADIGKGLQHVAGLHRQHFLPARCGRAPSPEGRTTWVNSSGRLIADIVDPRRRRPAARRIGPAERARRASIPPRTDIVDMGEVPPHFAMVKELDRLPFQRSPWRTGTSPCPGGPRARRR